MEPEENPYAALLFIDYAAMKAREYSYLIELRDSPEWVDESRLLNIHYSAALAEYMVEKDEKTDHINSTASLSRAIQKFPWLIAQLFYALKIEFPEEFPTTVPPTPLDVLYTDLYIHRSKDLWMVPEISAWIQSVAKQTATQVIGPELSDSSGTIPINVARHIFVMGVPVLMSHIPRSYTSRTQLTVDPLPPEDSVNPYHEILTMNYDDLARVIENVPQHHREVGDQLSDDDGAEEASDGEEEEQSEQSTWTWMANALREAFDYNLRLLTGRADTEEEEDDEQP